jgi:hypothetical protein
MQNNKEKTCWSIVKNVTVILVPRFHNFFDLLLILQLNHNENSGDWVTLL